MADIKGRERGQIGSINSKTRVKRAVRATNIPFEKRHFLQGFQLPLYEYLPRNYCIYDFANRLVRLSTLRGPNRDYLEGECDTCFPFCRDNLEKERLRIIAHIG